ncbi:unnamed protein product [Diatraea saccharalis]|uniref:CWF19-like protein 2 n=1 Tax=Diatraea saccharalis TaxID=40085 RepID=A0A9P0C7W8_9NEOP|nr:unnamed protein product [Diatraea saccharalis]
MKESRDKDKRSKKSKRKEKRKRYSSSSSSTSESDQWVEKEQVEKPVAERDDWMSMTGMLKTYTKDDIKPKQEENKKHIDSYNPSTSVRELNPYWKNGGTGLPQTSAELRKSRQFLKPDDTEDYYRKSSSSKEYEKSGIRDKSYKKQDEYHRKDREAPRRNWKIRSEEKSVVKDRSPSPQPTKVKHLSPPAQENYRKIEITENLYMSDEKLNKLAAKVVKAEILGDTEQVAKLKAKLEAAREYRKQNPNAGKEDDDGVMLMSTTSSGSSRPLANTAKGDSRSKGGKRKAETYTLGERTKYFGNDDKYNLAQMFEQEKYGNNYDNDAQLARVAGSHKNPNDDLEDIFLDDISKNRNVAKDRDVEKQRAIKQHVKLERSLEGCEYCVDSKNMLKHLMVSCGSKVYVAVPSKQSLVRGQCVISTIQHNTCVTALDEDVWEEIMTYRRALTQFYNSQSQDVVFFELATKLHRFPHMVINCVPVPRDVGDMASIYFKKALLECETEWSMNKKVVELKGKDIRKGIPKGLPYFWVDFGMDPGFAHVIEDQQLFPRNFGEEIIGGMLDLDHHLWKNPRKEYGDLQRKKVLDFIKEWKPFDPNKKINI